MLLLYPKSRIPNPESRRAGSTKIAYRGVASPRAPLFPIGGFLDTLSPRLLFCPLIGN